MVFPISFAHWAELFLLLVVRLSTWLSKRHPKNSAVITKLHSTCPQEQFGGNISSKKSIRLFLLFWKIEPTVYGFSSDMFRQGFRNCNLRVQKPEEHFDEEKHFRKNAFFHFLTLIGNLSDSRMVVKSALFVSRGTIWGRKAFPKALFVFKFELKSSLRTFGGQICFHWKNFFFHQTRLLVEHFSAFNS